MGEELNYKSALTIEAAVRTGGASLEEVYWKVRMYNIIRYTIKGKGYTFDELELEYLINDTYNGLFNILGFPHEVTISNVQLAKLMLDNCIERHKRLSASGLDEFDDLYADYENVSVGQNTILEDCGEGLLEYIHRRALDVKNK